MMKEEAVRKHLKAHWFVKMKWMILMPMTTAFVAGYLSTVLVSHPNIGLQLLKLLIAVLVSTIIVTALVVQKWMYSKKNTISKEEELQINSTDHFASVLKNAAHFRFETGWFGQYTHYSLVEVVQHKKPESQNSMEMIRIRIYASVNLLRRSNENIMLKEALVMKPDPSVKWVIIENHDKEDELIEANIKKGLLYQILKESYPETDKELKKAIKVAKSRLNKDGRKALGNNSKDFVASGLSSRTGYSSKSRNHFKREKRRNWNFSHLGEKTSSLYEVLAKTV